MEVFTPLNADKTERLRFNREDVKVLEDNGFHLRKAGYRATVEIKGNKYKVYGKACSLPNCVCDAYIVPTA